MIDDEPSVKDMARLWNICATFIRKNEITVEKAIVNPEYIMQVACYNLVGQILNEVGYYEEES